MGARTEGELDRQIVAVAVAARGDADGPPDTEGLPEIEREGGAVREGGREGAADGADGRGLLPGQRRRGASAAAATVASAEAAVRESRRDAPHDARRGSPRRQQQRREVPVREGGRARESRGREQWVRNVSSFSFLSVGSKRENRKRKKPNRKEKRKKPPHQTPNASSIAERRTPVAAFPEANNPLPETAAAMTANFVR